MGIGLVSQIIFLNGSPRLSNSLKYVTKKIFGGGGSIRQSIRWFVGRSIHPKIIIYLLGMNRQKGWCCLVQYFAFAHSILFIFIIWSSCVRCSILTQSGLWQICDMSISGGMLKFFIEHIKIALCTPRTIGLRPGGEIFITPYSEFGFFVPAHIIQPRLLSAFTDFANILALVSSK